MTRATTWTNSDGLVVGFGKNYPERQATADTVKSGAIHEAVMDFTYESTSPALELPAGAVVRTMVLKIGTAWVSSGTVTMTIGDGGAATGWYTATLLTEANLTAGAVLVPDGAYAVGDNADNMGNAKVYASADTIDVAISGSSNAPSSGTARLIVEYWL
jgi:hypothetical protein